MIRRATIFCLCCCLVGIFLAAATSAQSVLIFASNYDAKLVIDGHVSHITNRAKVRNGSIIPIEFQKHRIDIKISEEADSKFRADINLFERSGGNWYQVNADELSFEGNYTTPVEYQWNVGGVSLDLAIIVSIARQ